MDIYDIIADDYDSIFPVENDKLQCILSHIKNNGAAVLDIGCATGELSYRIKENRNDAAVCGIDVNEKMIAIAKEKYRGTVNLNYAVRDMMSIDEEHRYDLMLCIGNTLPHLRDKGELAFFLRAAYKALNRRGALILQFLNYDKIVQENRVDFAAIETAAYKFTRRYAGIARERIRFELELSRKGTSSVLATHTYLMPIFETEIRGALMAHGFENIGMYGNWDKAPSRDGDFYKVVVAEKV